jgi:hypothetical protein
MNFRTGAFPLSRRGRLLAAVVAAVVILGSLAVVGWLARWPAGVFGGSARPVSAPAGAVTAVTNLTSRNPGALRAALAAGYPVSPGDAAPAGTTIRVRLGTWEQRGDYATVRAVVTLPGRAPLAETVYFAREEGRWRVLFADPS